MAYRGNNRGNSRGNNRGNARGNYRGNNRGNYNQNHDLHQGQDNGQDYVPSGNARGNYRGNSRGNYNQNHDQHQGQGTFQDQSSSGNAVQLAVKGWALPPSKFANDPPSGVNAVIIFLEKKSGCKIINSKTVGRDHILLIDIDANDASRFHHLNGFTFSGAPITVEASRSQPNTRTPLGPGQQNQQSNQFSNAPNGPRAQRDNNGTPTGPRGTDLFSGSGGNNSFKGNNTFGSNNNQNQNTFGQNQQNQPKNLPRDSRDPPEKQQLEALMISIIRKRYNPDNQFLTFEALSTDGDVQASKLVEASPTKVWTAFFTMCESSVFETAAKRRDMVQSVSLANNGLRDVKDVIGLSATFPQLKNLDLSSNDITQAGDLRFWRNSFKSLEHLLILNNPIATKPDELRKLARWFRSLKMLNNESVTPDGMALDVAFEPRVDSPAPPILSHPEVDITQFGQPLPGKTQEQLVMEQMGLKFSVETHLKLVHVEALLKETGFNYDAAMQNFRRLYGEGAVPADAFLG